eukprot:3159118-Rhodomonas_salina.2
MEYKKPPSQYSPEQQCGFLCVLLLWTRLQLRAYQDPPETYGEAPFCTSSLARYIAWYRARAKSVPHDASWYTAKSTSTQTGVVA